jgi:hypothetical protein
MATRSGIPTPATWRAYAGAASKQEQITQSASLMQRKLGSHVEGTSRREVDVEHGGDRLRVGRAPGSIVRANEAFELVGRFAAALELVHSASLIQEGLVAGDERHGRATAILDACATVTFDSRGSIR